MGRVELAGVGIEVIKNGKGNVAFFFSLNEVGGLAKFSYTLRYAPLEN